MAMTKTKVKTTKKVQKKSFLKRLFSFEGLKVWYKDGKVWFKKTLRW